MNLADLERIQAANVRPTTAQALTLFAPYAGTAISATQWLNLLLALFGLVAPASERAAAISRAHYDAERARQGLPPHAIPLALLTYERFVKDMDAVRRPFHYGASAEDIHLAALRVARSIENSGRWTVMKAAEYPDPAIQGYSEQLPPRASPSSGPSLVKGWARVATGAETCGWCWMLVSRGPVYRSAESAGSTLDNRDAMQTVGSENFNASEHMNAWHTGCDCKVVPVFRLDDWDGRDRYLAAEKLWIETSKGAKNNQDAINRYRRAVEAGRIQEILQDNPRLAASA